MQTGDERGSFRRTSNEDEIETSGTRGGSAGDDGVYERGSLNKHGTDCYQCADDQSAQHHHDPNHRAHADHGPGN
jgi:hypothetical protein